MVAMSNKEKHENNLALFFKAMSSLYQKEPKNEGVNYVAKEK